MFPTLGAPGVLRLTSRQRVGLELGDASGGWEHPRKTKKRGMHPHFAIASAVGRSINPLATAMFLEAQSLSENLSGEEHASIFFMPVLFWPHVAFGVNFGGQRDVVGREMI